MIWIRPGCVCRNTDRSRVLERRPHDGADHHRRIERRLQIESRLAEIADDAQGQIPVSDRP